MEGDRRVLGHVFGSPDCSGECRGAYAGYDPSQPLLDAVRIGWEDAVMWMADGRLEVAVEIDAPRQALSCSAHPWHPRCFPSLQDDRAPQGQAAGGIDPAHYTWLAAAVDGSTRLLRVASAAALGLAPALVAGALRCPTGGCCGAGACGSAFFIQVEGEVMSVVGVAGDNLTVARAAAATEAAPHPAAAGVVKVDPKLLPALENEGDFSLHALVLSYAT